MSNLRAITIRHIVPPMIVSATILLAVAVTNAEDNPTATGRVAAILDEFQKTWDDEAWGPADASSGHYMRRADDRGWKARAAAFQQIVQIGAAGVPELVSALEAESAPVRALAAQLLGYCGTADTRPAMLRLIERDPNAMVRLYAADSWGMLGGRDQDGRVRRLEANEKNPDTKRHIQYALDRDGQALNAAVATAIRGWKAQRLASASLNQLAPDFELVSLNGEKIRLSQFRGKKIVVLVFVYGDT